MVLRLQLIGDRLTECRDAGRRGGIVGLPAFEASMHARVMWAGGVGKSGSPMERPMTSMPCARICAARSDISMVAEGAISATFRERDFMLTAEPA